MTFTPERYDAIRAGLVAAAVPHQPANPEQALQWQQERDAKYPDGWDVPLFQSDGTTQIGVFHIG